MLNPNNLSSAAWKNNIHTISINVTANAFQGLAKQNMSCPQSVMELVDNAIAAGKPGEKALVQIFLLPDSDGHMLLVVCDWGVGMDLTALTNALQLGSLPTSNCRLNEHGFGLNNALASLTGGTCDWSLQTRKSGGPILKVEGPFNTSMSVVERNDFDLPYGLTLTQPNPSTVIIARVPMSFARTLQGRGAPCNNLNTLRLWLVEHLGVAYRGYLEQDAVTGDVGAKILVTVGNEDKLVRPIYVPMENTQTVILPVCLGGSVVPVEYTCGVLSKCMRDTALDGQPTRYYYQGNVATQGVDIRLGKRVIATSMLCEIWPKNDGGMGQRHPGLNDFVGEIRIPELPRGVLSALNNKTGINMADEDWQLVFDELADHPPEKAEFKSAERKLSEAWYKTLKVSSPYGTVTDQMTVWPTGTRIDLVREDRGALELYEMKAGKAEPLHLYQLKMYRDGMILAGKQPTEALLLVKESRPAMQLMVDAMNKMNPPDFPDDTPSAPYNFKIALHKEKNLSA